MWKYRVVENTNEEHAAIELLDSKFEGLVYQYGKVTWNEDNFQLNFERTIRRLPTENPEGKTVEDLNKDNDLQEIMGTILVELLDESAKGQNNGEDRKNNPTTPDME